MQSHIRSVHLQKRSHPCTMCVKVFTRNEHARKHMLEAHGIRQQAAAPGAQAEAVGFAEREGLLALGERVRNLRAQPRDRHTSLQFILSGQIVRHNRCEAAVISQRFSALPADRPCHAR